RAAETAAGAGGEQEGGDAHGAKQCGCAGLASTGRRRDHYKPAMGETWGCSLIAPQAVCR
ncbi:hypothetical protein, partial [Endobacter medicaginis]|uniref:hypothetical protein n=1 Tax=Endobacter medicaginis TaxID=1181271 RepID=UPI001C3FFD14